MTMLIDIHSQVWMNNDDFRKQISTIDDANIRFYPELGDVSSIHMLVSDWLRPGLVKQLPHLQLIQKLGAGVDTMVSDPDLPEQVRIARLKHNTTAMEMARFCMAYVLRDVQNMVFHSEQQRQGVWHPVAPKRVADLQVGVLGLGHIGSATAGLFSSAGFAVTGWSRSEKHIDGIRCVYGGDALFPLLEQVDYLVSILPSTSATINLFDREVFKFMKPDSMLINVGRGTLIVEKDLVEALDQKLIRHAVLDVCQQEPLPADSPLWHHPGITVTPHVSGWDLGDGLSVVADNYYRLLEGRPILHEISRESGY